LPVFSVLSAIREVLKLSLLWAALVMAAIATVDWFVRTRRISPFSPVARFMRNYIDPLMAPIERRVTRAGGLPANAPWWALGIIVVAGILLLALFDFVGGLIADLMVGFSNGTNGIVRLLVFWTFTLLRVAIIVRVISSWLPFGAYSPWIRWSFTLSEPILRPLRRIIPPIKTIDITPLVVFFGLGVLEGFLRDWLR
jgi:YggT family protein